MSLPPTRSNTARCRAQKAKWVCSGASTRGCCSWTGRKAVDPRLRHQPEKGSAVGCSKSWLFATWTETRSSITIYPVCDAASPPGFECANLHIAVANISGNDTPRSTLLPGAYRNKADEMKKLLAIATTALTIAAFTMDSASARHHHRHHRIDHGMTTGMGAGGGMRGNNAELGGNNGNSASGSNSLGHIPGGDSGAGK
jgi:hypothetical protein